MNTTGSFPIAGLASRAEQPIRSALPRIDYRLRRRNRSLNCSRLVRVLRTECPDLYERAEVVGRWVWVQFAQPPTVNLRRQLAELGFHWNRSRQAWQHPGGSRSAGAGWHPRQQFFTYFPADLNPL